MEALKLLHRENELLITSKPHWVIHAPLLDHFQTDTSFVHVDWAKNSCGGMGQHRRQRKLSRCSHPVNASFNCMINTLDVVAAAAML